MSLTDDAPVWMALGHDIIRYFVAVTVKTFVIAIYSILVFKTSFLLLSRMHRTKVSLFMCTVIIVMFCFALSLWMIDIHTVVLEVQATLLSDSAAPISDIYASAIRQILQLASVEDVLYAYMTVLGDILIIWRVYAFWSRGPGRVVLIVPFAFLLGSISTAMMLSYCAARLGADIKLGTFQSPEFCRNIQTASYSMTLATTAVATVLIGYKFWDYQRVDNELFQRMSRSSRRQKLMLVLVESGVAYMLFFLVQVVMSFSSVNASVNKRPALVFASTVYSFNTSLIVARFLFLVIFLSGMYPTAVVLLVHSKHITQVSGPVNSVKRLKSSRGRVHVQAPLSDDEGSTQSMPVRMARTRPTEVDLYEMTSLSDSGLKGTMDAAKDGSLLVEVHHAMEQRVM
ncbi:hypothetical protein PYCCODRAFT_1470113 [Trametes coccinea BRFM310]|uniref:G-protein coupled receptors family 1 profile domain-containing protein n=1 Tax=Trametes coccinea (strain BRFM310) TaxID=1353009 RepID=A0A1Y2IEM2_TRAC3|nr:hypothetical protein PYCCODRAFT_1470113 [Trametes coccinea BRFM310]